MLKWIALWVLFWSILDFALMGADKRRAKQHRWRVPEKTFFLIALAGGSPGAVLGMRLFHHKTRHRAFVWGIPAILILEAGAALGFLSLPNPGAEEGISASIRLGLSAMGGMEGVLFSVCDQPFLTTDSIINLLRSFEQSKNAICALSWQGQRGNPVIFPADLFMELAALTGDTGGGAVIRRHPERLALVEAPSPRELADLDTPADWAGFA